MNIYEWDIIKEIYKNSFGNQRQLAMSTGHSLGLINQGLKNLVLEGYLNEKYMLTTKAKKLISGNRPSNAIILAAGFGMRMVPINKEMPKALLRVKGQILIERVIEQLKEVGINKIYVVVGFMKEHFEYLIDDYGVELIVNSDYVVKNNLYSLYKAIDHIDNSYIVPSDIWCRENPFEEFEPYSWYMVSDKDDNKSTVYINRKKELQLTNDDHIGKRMYGISYIEKKDAALLKSKMQNIIDTLEYDDLFWEEALFSEKQIKMYARSVSENDIAEINTFEQLKEFDNTSESLKSEVIDIICDALNVTSEEIKEINVLKKGMTNRSFIFSCLNRKYIMRIPGEGTDMLINRKQEAEVYKVIKKDNYSDKLLYINPKNGYKLTEYMEASRNCDPFNKKEVKKSMKFLREFHNSGLKVNHVFDLFERLEFYEALWNGEKSVYHDYDNTKKNVLSLKDIIDKNKKEYCLTHIDAVPDNFIFTRVNGKEQIKLIDWEYASMQDPDVDIAMFGIYSLYDKEHMDNLIDAYYEEGCLINTRIKIYAYISICGLLWSNWCEYKRIQGVEFGEYSLRQYRYAKDYYRLVNEMLDGE